MLAADKLQLQSQLRQQAVSLKEKEFNLHHSNLMTVGTQAAVLAGLDITMFIEFTPAPLKDWVFPFSSLSHHSSDHDASDVDTITRFYWIIPRVLTCIYYTMISAAFCSNIMVVSQTTALSVLGAGLALRGPDGSMMVATDALYQEREKVFSTFARGLALTAMSVLVGVWLMLNWETALACWCVAMYTCYSIYTNYHRVATILDFDERDTVDFRDIMDGPGNVRLAPHHKPPQHPHYNNNNNSRRPNINKKRSSDATTGGGSSTSNHHYQQQQQRHHQHPSVYYSTNDDDSYRKHNDYRSSGGSRNNQNNQQYYDNNYEESEGSYSSGNTDDVEMQSRSRLLSSPNGGKRSGGNASSSRRRRANVESTIQTV